MVVSGLLIEKEVIFFFLLTKRYLTLNIIKQKPENIYINQKNPLASISLCGQFAMLYFFIYSIFPCR